MDASALPPATRLDHGITLLDTLQERPGMAACYLLERGEDLAFIETGTAPGVPRLLAWMAQQGLARERVRYVIPTHVHLDHAGGAGTLMAALPNAQLVVHPRGARHLIDPTQLIAGATAVYGEAFMKRTYGKLLPVPAERVLPAADNARLPLGNAHLRVIDSPGHARHHFCLYDEDSRGLFTGDTFGLSYREFDTARGAFLMPTTTPVQFDPDAWMQSLDRLTALAPQRLYLTHYGPVEGVPALAEQLREGLRRYVAIAESAPPGRPEDRCAWLRAALEAETLAALRSHGCALDEASRRRLLATDLALNAQGLAVWLDRAA
jgi:glyoxylase-like metal-dependent hydrolase (beta-lactamase superfamily II)